MLTEIEYRPFDELLDSVRIDIKTHDLEGVIEPAQLIKVAARVSYELGLKINPSRSKTIEVTGGKAKLPSDFNVLNFALLCDDKRIINQPLSSYPYQYKTYCQGVVDGVEFSEDLIRATMTPLFTETLDLPSGNTTITHNLNTRNFIVQIKDPNGNEIDAVITTPTVNTITVANEAGETIADAKVTIIGGVLQTDLQCMFDNLNPCSDGVVTTACSNTTNCNPCTDLVTDSCSSHVACTNSDGSSFEYHTLIPLKIDKAKTLSADSFNIMTRSRFTAMLKNGFLVCNFDEGTVYINYQSLMEDDQGTLLVMSHPLVDEFYEYAIKQRVYENLVLSGDNSAVTPLQLVEAKLRIARNNAMSFINTPDFSEMRKVWELNRKAQYHNYYNMFKSSGVVNMSY